MRGLFFFVILSGLTLAQFNEDEFADKKRLMGVGLLWLIGLLFSLIPLAFRLRVHDDYVESYFLTHRIVNIRASQVQTVNHEFDIFSGRGIRIRALSNGHLRTHFLAEDFVGKKGITHASQILAPQKFGNSIHSLNNNTSASNRSTPRYRIAGSIGAVAAMGMFFFALTKNELFSKNVIVGLLAYPGSLLAACFSVGYAIDGKLKTAVRFGSYFILLILAVSVLGLIKHYTK